MKTTIDIQDALLLRAKRYAKRNGHPLRAVVEEGLRLVLSTPVTRSRYRLPDMSVGEPDGPDPLEAYSWQDLRDMIYGNPGTP
ncbi:MAG: DUF2191 domain-containing protein [Acidobacteria bacterium]|nr:DUF2191 domain-containing protein [Acidobacteriota bacterium]